MLPDDFGKVAMPFAWFKRTAHKALCLTQPRVDEQLNPAPLNATGVLQPSAAEALVDAISRWPEWVTRRVDSVHLLERSRGRRKHSIDCVPPPDPKLAYDVEEQHNNDINLVRGQLMVPLAFISKAPMRHLDVSQTSGSPMPILGSGETSALMISALVSILKKSGVTESVELEQAMQTIVTSSGSANQLRARNLAETGLWEGERLWPSTLQLDAETEAFLLDLSTDFVLIGLIPAADSGVRQVLKFSYHWTLNWTSTKLENTRTAFRMTGSEIHIPMHMPAAAKSYHLEFQVPPELGIRELTLPIGQRESSTVESGVDTTWSPVAHTHASFEEVPAEDASAVLIVPRRGPWTSALLVSALTAAVFLLALTLPGATDTLVKVGGNAAALLLAAPAVFVSFLAIQRENAFTSRLLDPLRFVVATCALLLFAMAASIVGGLLQPWLSILWIVGAVIATGFTAALVFGDRVDKMPKHTD